MVSGTIANKRRMEEKRAANLRRIKASAERNKALEVNREKIIAEVCALFGWKELDPFAKKMVDKALAGKIVDIEQLQTDIEEWKKAQKEGEKTNGDIPTE